MESRGWREVCLKSQKKKCPRCGLQLEWDSVLDFTEQKEQGTMLYGVLQGTL